MYTNQTLYILYKYTVDVYMHELDKDKYIYIFIFIQFMKRIYWQYTYILKLKLNCKFFYKL